MTYQDKNNGIPAALLKNMQTDTNKNTLNESVDAKADSKKDNEVKETKILNDEVVDKKKVTESPVTIKGKTLLTEDVHSEPVKKDSPKDSKKESASKKESKRDTSKDAKKESPKVESKESAPAKTYTKPIIEQINSSSPTDEEIKAEFWRRKALMARH